MEDPLSSTYHIGLLVFMIVSVIVLALLIWAGVTRRHTEEHREETLFRLGYTPASPPPAQLVTRLTELLQRGDLAAPEIRNVYRRPIAGGEIYLFDLLDAHVGEGAHRSSDNLAVVSAALDLPCVTLVPKPALLQHSRGSGLLAKLADVALEAAAAQIGRVELDYTDDPEFAENFIVLAEDATAARALLTEELRTQLLQWDRRYIINATENLFTLTRDLDARPVTLPEDNLQTEQEDAEQLLSWLRKGGISYV